LGLELLERVDDADEAFAVAAVVLGDPRSPPLLCFGDHLVGASELGAVGVEVGCVGEEALAAKTGVRVRTGLLQRQPAVAVWQRLAGAGELLLGPLGLLQGFVLGGEDLAVDVDPLLLIACSSSPNGPDRSGTEMAQRVAAEPRQPRPRATFDHVHGVIGSPRLRRDSDTNNAPRARAIVRRCAR